MDDRLKRISSSVARLADALGLEAEAASAIFLGAFFHGTESGKAESGPAAAEDGSEALVSFLELAAEKAQALGDGERRARQTANGIRAAGFALASSLDTDVVLQALLDYLNWLVPYEGASVLFREEGGRLQVAAAREWRRKAARYPTDEDLLLAERSIDLREPLYSSTASVKRLILPLLGPTGPVGAVLLVRDGAVEFDEEQTRAAEAFAGQAAAAVRNSLLFGQLKTAQEELVRSYDASIEVLSSCLDLRDHETEGHSLRVADLSLKLGAALGMGESDLERLRRGALLHDIGKIGIPDTILHKAGPLTEDEMDIMRKHSDLGKDLLAGISFLAPSIDIPYCHHERWDGKGYPRGISGELIPLSARVFSIVDVWDALVNDRPYRKAVTHLEARKVLASVSGTQLDPVALDKFLSLPLSF